MSEDVKALVEEAHEAVRDLQSVAWSRMDGGQEASLYAGLIDRLAKALEARSGRDEGLEEAAKVADQHAEMCADLAYDYSRDDKRDIAHIWKTAHSQMSACAKDIRALKDKQP